MMRRTNPFDEIERMFGRMSRQFDDMSRQWDGGMMGVGAPDIALDVADHDDEVVVTADLPGFEKEDIDLTVSGRTLTISAEREHHAEREEGEYLRRERRAESMRRSISLPEEVDEESAAATYTNGVLTVTLPKVDVEDDSRHIDIE
jgi:HSP20 family protein